MTRPVTEKRTAYRYFRRVPTRWMDNDVYGHVNNVVYYSYFDTVVNAFLVHEGGLDFESGSDIGLCVESQCRFHESVSFPDVLDAGLRVAKIGRSSVRYEVGIFRAGEDSAVAQGHFVHVFVDRVTRRPVDLPERMRAALTRLA
ncbi:MAG: acyl-CoA thioesterase [Myxococcaceae bacterium]